MVMLMMACLTTTPTKEPHWGISFSTYKNHVDSCIGGIVWNKLLQYKILTHSFFWWAFLSMWCCITSYKYSLWVGKKWSRDFIWQKKIPLLGKNLNMNGHRNVCVYLFIYLRKRNVCILADFSAFIHMSYFISSWVGFIHKKMLYCCLYAALAMCTQYTTKVFWK